MSLISFYAPCKHKKILNILMFSGYTERHQLYVNDHNKATPLEHLPYSEERSLFRLTL